MQKLLAPLLPGLLVLGISTAVASGDADSPAAAGQQPPVTAVQAPGYPLPSGKGPGSGHSYRQGTPGPGQGAPNYQGGRSGQTAKQDESGSSQNAPQYPARRGVGLGYPYNGMNRDGYRSRGYGYGRGRRGYGYGYPGYRGQGGSPYPGHRQYGNPSIYNEHPAAADLPATQE